MTHEETSRASAHTTDGLIESYLWLLSHGVTPTVVRLCKTASCSRASFYRRFDSLEAVKEAALAKNTCLAECRHIARNAGHIPLETATDLIVQFFEERTDAVAILLRSALRDEYLERQVAVLKPMFAILISRALDMTPIQFDFIAELLARNRMEMVRLWVERGQAIGLGQINKLWENVVEEALWNPVAFQSPLLGGPYPRTKTERHLYDYPWLDYLGLLEAKSLGKGGPSENAGA